MNTPQNKKEKEICWKKCPNAIATPHVHNESPAPQEKDWQKEFWKEFTEGENPGDPETVMFYKAAPHEVIAFISKVEQQAEERGRIDTEIRLGQEHGKNIVELTRQARTQSQKELLGKIEKMIGEVFKKLRFDNSSHLGMGDVRLTIGQQEALLTELKTLE